MDDFMEQTVVMRHKGLNSVLYGICWVIIVTLGIAALIGLYSFLGVNPETGRLSFNLPALILALAAGGAAFLAYRGKDNLRLEYDYAFTNGTLDVSSVMNNRRRRYLCAMETREMVRCGPASGPDFAKTLAEPGIRRHNWFLNRDSRLYYFYFQKKGVKHVAVLELNDDMVQLIRSRKYLPAGAWRDADGKSEYAGVS